MENGFRDRGFSTTVTRFYESPDLPDLNDVDFLVVMGGSMSVNDEKTHPWIAGETAFIREAIDAGKPVLGICLGAQLIAKALGAAVYPNAHKEIGWWPVDRIDGGENAAHRFPDSMTVYQWHGDTFDLPDGAIPLARSEGCPNQAFQFRKAIGLQFHLEMTPAAVKALVANCGNEIIPGPYVQKGPEMLNAPFTRYASTHRELHRLLVNLTGRPVRSPDESVL